MSLRSPSKRRDGLRWRLLVPIAIVVPVVAAAAGFGYHVLSSADDAALVQQRAASVVAVLEHRLEERQQTKEIFAQLVAARDGLSGAVVREDPVAVAQILVPLKARLDLGFVHAHGPDMTLLGDNSDEMGHLLEPLGVSAMAGVSHSLIALALNGVVVAAASPVKGPKGVVGWVEVGVELSVDDLAAMTDDGVEIAIFRGDRLLSSTFASGPLEALLAVPVGSDGTVDALNARLANEHLWAVRHALPDGGFLVAIVPTADLSAASQRRALVILIGTVIAVCALLMVILAVVRSVTVPLQAMVGSTAAMVRGDYRQRVRRGGIRELDELAGAINHVAAEVEEQMAELTRRAFHDELTRLPNRALFLDRLEHALARGHRSGQPAIVCLLDIDDFKTINDSLGHEAGDQLLILAADRINGILRPADTLARFGGDEFTLLVEDAEPGSGPVVAGRIAEALVAPFRVMDRDVVVTVSIGVAVASRAATPETLLRDADVAMYQAKADGKRRMVVFDASMHAAALAKLELEADLRHAIERGELVLHYQPVVRLGTGKIIGHEALVRWNHPKRGLLSPGEFIPLAEESGLIMPLGAWVLGTAIEQAKGWATLDPHLTMSVNLSAAQFRDVAFVGTIEAALESSGLDPRTLTLEVTESVVMRDVDVTLPLLAAIKRLGVRLAIDDFGTGYSSLSYLRQFPFDELKIDKSFVRDMMATREGGAMLTSIVRLAATLRMSSVAEGVEDAAQAQRLRELGCEAAQGFYFARPAPSDAAGRLLTGGTLPVDQAAELPPRKASGPEWPPRELAASSSRRAAIR